jgi:hypothetical protein
LDEILRYFKRLQCLATAWDLVGLGFLPYTRGAMLDAAIFAGGIVGTIDKRRYERFGYDGTAMLVFDDPASRHTLAITNYRNISQGGACIQTPNIDSLQIGDHVFIMPERYRRKREAVVVDLGTGRLHLELSRNQELTDFELAELIQRLDYHKVP